MENLVVKGGKKIAGKVTVSGAKNAVLPAMAVSLLVPGRFEIYNVPALNDIKMMSHLLRVIGARVDHRNHTLHLDTNNCSFWEAPYELVSKMRASIYVLSPLLARFGQAYVSLPGGCAIGARPIDLHLKALKKMGAQLDITNGYIVAKVKKLQGADIFFDKTSVGATITVLMAAVTAEGKTNIINAAQEPEVTYICELLQKMGAEISGKGTAELNITGVDKLQPVNTKVIPDRIEAGTFLIAGAITGGDITVTNCLPHHLLSLIDKLAEAGCEINSSERQASSASLDYPGAPSQNEKTNNEQKAKDRAIYDRTGWVRLKAQDKSGKQKRLKAVDLTTKPYPGFPTDLQAQMTALMSIADGTSVIEETVFSERFHHVPELNRLGAKIILDKNRAIVEGVQKLEGAKIMATDLRASAALVLAGLAAEGETTISRIYHLDRGYEKMEKKLQQLSADIVRSG